jgi:hypothetical protein
MALSKLRSDSFIDNAITGQRNLIINGAMQVAQRGTSATVGPNGTGEGYTTVDRFENQLNGSVVSTFTQSTDAPPGFANSAKIEVTTADSSLSASEFWQLRQGIEGQNLQSIGKGTSDAKSLTVSFWVKSNKTGTYTAELQDVDNDRSNGLAYTINSSNTWEHKTLTYNADTSGAFNNDNGESVRLTFWLVADTAWSSGTFTNGTWGAATAANRVHSSQVNLGDTVGNEWYITGVQLEVGEQATPFEHRLFGDELYRCQRYCYVWKSKQPWDAFCDMNIWSSSGILGQAIMPQQMRADPSVTYRALGDFVFSANNADRNLDSLSTNRITTREIQMYAVDSNHGFSLGVGGFLRDDGNNNTRLTFDSEL